MRIIDTFMEDPVFLTFSLVLIGLRMGKYRIFNVRLDIAAVLVCALFWGLMTDIWGIDIVDSKVLSGISSLGSAMFIASTGIQSGQKSEPNRKGRTRSIATGILMSLTGTIVTSVILLLDRNVPVNMALGLLSGGLTSTPALAVINEFEGASVLATAGYGLSYYSGVLMIVAFVQLVFRRHIPEQVHTAEVWHCPIREDGITILAIAILLGVFVGQVPIPFLNGTIGMSGGILLGGLLVGKIMRHRIEKDQFSFHAYKQLGLLLFFIGTGIPAGAGLREYFQLKYLIYGMMTPLITILVGYILTKLLFKMPDVESCAIVCGGMTSTPGMGILQQYSNASYQFSQYSFTYIAALLTLLLSVRLLNYIVLYIGR